MGGGIAMRAAAKAAGIGVLHGVRSGEKPVVTAARNATRSVSTAVANSNSDDLKLSVNGNDLNKSVEKVVCYDDEWDFAGVEDELFMEAAEAKPRLVFGGAPSIHEAKQATSDLNDALKMTYLSSYAFNGQKSDFEHSETTPSVVTETLVNPLASTNAMHAFRLLNENPKAQTVVASIACDPNVWNAVMQNQDLVDFLHCHQTESIPETDSPGETPKASDSKFESGKSFRDYVEDFKQKITDTVVDMMNSLSDMLQSFFGGSSKDGVNVNPDGTAGINADKTMAATLMGLAIMVITLVVLKRPAA